MTHDLHFSLCFHDFIDVRCMRMSSIYRLRVSSSAPALKATAPTHMKWAGAVAGWTGLLSFHESYAG